MVTLVMVMNRMTLVYIGESIGMMSLVMMMNRMALVYRDGDTGDEKDDMSL